MMNFKRCFVFASILFITSILQANASSVWKVSNGANSVFIGGTIHLMKAEDYPLSDSYAKAYDLSDTLIFETDIATIEAPAFQQKMLSEMMYTDGSTLKAVLKESIFNELKAQFQVYGMSVDPFMSLKPIASVLTLTVMEFQKLGFTEKGVDAYFYKKAQEDGKSTGELETADEQLAFIMSMGEGNQNEMVEYSLKDLAGLPKMVSGLRSAWLKGDVNGMAHIGLQPMMKDFPDIYKTLIVDRNSRWIPQIEKMLTTPKVEYILVGGLHLAGPDSILLQLTQKGFIVEKIK